MREKKTMIPIRLKPDVHAKLKELSEQQGRSMNEIATELLCKYLKRKNLMDVEIEKK